MSQFLLRQESSSELQHFAHIEKFALKKITSISLNSFKEAAIDFLRFYYVIDGKYNWIIEGRNYTLYPNDLAVILPGQTLVTEQGYLDIGSIYSLYIQLNTNDHGSKNFFGPWCNFNQQECTSIKKLLFLNTTPVVSRLLDAGTIFQHLRNEIFGQNIGYITRVNQLIDELLIQVTRKLTQQNISHRDFPQTFLKLEETLRKNLSHHWTVEEMAAMVGLGTTAFSDKVKNFTGFSPMNYLINIRISEAIKLLKRMEANVTDIALDTGFYSSQHFSTTFKKLTGYTPSEFRKNNISKN